MPIVIIHIMPIEKLASGAQISAEYSVNLLSNRPIDLITEKNRTDSLERNKN